MKKKYRSFLLKNKNLKTIFQHPNQQQKLSDNFEIEHNI